MAVMATLMAVPELILRSHEPGWDRRRWETLPADGNRYEVIDGVLYVTTAPSAFHQWIVQRLFLTLHQQIDSTGAGTTFLSPIGLFMPGCDPVQPDLLVIPAGSEHVFQRGRIAGIPALIVEVQSPSNPTYDAQVKRGAYARAGVPEYWIVRPASRDVLLCAEPDPSLGDYTRSQLFDERSTLTSASLPLEFPIETLFAGAPDTTL